RAHVMGEITKQRLAEWVVPHVLNGGAAIGVGVRVAQFRLGCAGKFLQEKRPDGTIPGEINQFLMRENGVSAGLGRADQNQKNKKSLSGPCYISQRPPHFSGGGSFRRASSTRGFFPH